MFPVGDNDTPGRGIPIITWALIAINVIVFLYEATLSEPALNQFFANWAMTPQNVQNALANPGAPGSMQALLTLITSQFLHGGWLHLIGNMLFLYVFGDDIEFILSAPLYLLFYLVCGIVAGLTQIFVVAGIAGGDPTIPNLGASGAVAGVLGAYIVLYPTRRVNVLAPAAGRLTAPVGVAAYMMLGLWFVQQFFYGIAALSPEAGAGVAYWAHIGGFICGALLILPFRGRAVAPGNAQNRIYQSGR
jgi:membrane associated rhomboid family serine protease